MSKCVIKDADGVLRMSSEYVAVLCNREEFGSAELFYESDVVSMGLAAKMITMRFYDHLCKLPKEQQQQICDAIGICMLGGTDEKDRSQSN